MNNLDRGMIKWMPFNSVVSSKQIIKELNSQKAKIKMPTLSNEQIIENEQKLIQAFYCNDTINITYYNNGKLYNINGIIKKIDSTYHRIYLNNTFLLFNQIIKINQS